MNESDINNLKWDSKKNREFYNIESWGNGYFDINEEGEIIVKASKYSTSIPVPLKKIVDHAKCLGLDTPILLRFPDIIKSRALRIVEAFTKVKKEIGYDKNYYLIYPIKVNQNKSVIDSLLSINEMYQGLEAGSKSELLAVLASTKDNKIPIVCNGYKDKEYIKIALIARKLGYNIHIIIEKMKEAEYVAELAKELKVTPNLGVRFRLALMLAGKWARSGGERSKFGLDASQILRLIAYLKEHNFLHCLNLLHCHQGSQIANIKDIQYYIDEIINVYIEIYKLGAPLKILDVGGGLAVDYEGSRTRSFNSTNYNLKEYAQTILTTIKDSVTKANIPLPEVYSESGRAVSAHHAVFVTNIIGVESILGENVELKKSGSLEIAELEYLLDSFDKLPINEIYSTGIIAMEKIHSKFNEGELTLEMRAKAEQIFSHIKIRVLENLNRSYRNHRDIYDALDEGLAKKLIANFSLFHSLPDSWAISQLFPVMPISHLNEKPTMRAIIEDITCDSDGVIKNYIDYQGNEPSIKLPRYNINDPYEIAIFLVGAYQEIMGNLHNLFGSVATLDIVLKDNGKFEVKKAQKASSKGEMLGKVGFSLEYLLENLDKQITNSGLSKDEQDSFKLSLINSLNSHTYLN